MTMVQPSSSASNFWCRERSISIVMASRYCEQAKVPIFWALTKGDAFGEHEPFDLWPGSNLLGITPQGGDSIVFLNDLQALPFAGPTEKV